MEKREIEQRIQEKPPAGFLLPKAEKDDGFKQGNCARKGLATMKEVAR